MWKTVHLQISVTVALAFIIAHVFNFIEIFISAYSLELMSGVLSFNLVRLP